MGEKFNLLIAGFDLVPAEQKLLIRVGWVVTVSAHMLWMWGMLGWLGIGVPFASAGDFRQLQTASNVSARLSIANEIRSQVRLRCEEIDWGKKGTITYQIERLQEEYKKYAEKGERYPEPLCQ